MFSCSIRLFFFPPLVSCWSKKCATRTRTLIRMFNHRKRQEKEGKAKEKNTHQSSDYTMRPGRYTCESKTGKSKKKSADQTQTQTNKTRVRHDTRHGHEVLRVSGCSLIPSRVLTPMSSGNRLPTSVLHVLDPGSHVELMSGEKWSVKTENESRTGHETHQQKGQPDTHTVTVTGNTGDADESSESLWTQTHAVSHSPCL